jgi:hypothetical protein
MSCETLEGSACGQLLRWMEIEYETPPEMASKIYWRRVAEAPSGTL